MIHTQTTQTVPAPQTVNRYPSADCKKTPNGLPRGQTPSGRDHISFSEIKTYQACPAKWHFQYVQKAKPEQLSGAMLLGTCVHAVLERVYATMLASDPLPPVEELMKTYRDCWAREARDIPVQFAKGQDATTLEATARRMIETFLAGEYACPEGKIIGIEEGFRVKLADDLPDLEGRVDMLTHHNGELVITDFKTARSIPTEDAADDQGEQLILYSKGCQPIARELGAKIRLRFLYISKTKETKVEALEVSVDLTRIERTMAIIRQVYRAMKNNVVYPAPSPITCTGCPFGSRCAGWHKAAK